MAIKLRPPPMGRSVIPRRPLSTILDRATARPLTLVTAAAGTGKTTALAMWAAATEHAVAWVSLDPDDRDPSRFWGHVLGALSRAGHPGIGQVDSAVAGIAHASEQSREVAVGVGNWFAHRDDTTILVLDDSDVLTTSTVLDGLDALVSRAPRGLRLVLAGRAEPALTCVARARARGLVTDVGGDALRFSLDDTHTFVAALGLDLTPEQVDGLHGCTEGWAAGTSLLLAAVSRGGNPSEVLHDPQARGGHVLEYVVVEVLGGLDAATRQFVRRTSILDRLTGPLCDAVAGTDDGARRLRELAQRTTLITAEGGRWFRHHHLLGGLLRQQLEEEGTELVEALHRRAAGWFEAAGMPTEAIRHRVAIGDTPAVVRAVEAVPEVSRFFEGLLLTSRDLATTRRWLESLPQPEELDPQVRCAIAWTFLGLGRLDLAERWSPLPDVPEVGGGKDVVRAGALVLRGVLDRLTGALDEAVRAARGGLSLSRPGAPTYIPALAGLGPNLYWAGELAEARELLRIAIPQMEPPRALLPLVTDLGHLALVEEELGHRDRAEELSRRALALAAQYGMRTHFGTSAALLARGRAATGNRALQLLRAAEASARRVGEPAVLIGILLRRAVVLRRQGSTCDADAAEREASIIAATGADSDALGAVFDRIAPTAEPTGARAELLRPFVTPLTERESSVLRLLRAGMTQREIGCELGVSVNTTKTHTKSIYRKLGAHDRDAALATARELRWIS